MRQKVTTSDRLHRVVSVLGMATIWPSLHNQLFFPITFSFHKEGSFESLGSYLLYSAVFMVTAIALAFFNDRHPDNRVFNNRGFIIGANVMGAIGIALLVLCDLNSDHAWLLTSIGSVLSAMFVPVAFMFWSLQLLYSNGNRASFSLALSYLLFCAIVILRLIFELHGWLFAIFCPLLSAALSVIALTHPVKKRFGQHVTSLRDAPRALAISTLILIYVATISRFITNPSDAAYDFPPMHRVLIYAYAALFIIPVAILHRPKAKNYQLANVVSFVIVAIALVGGLLLTGMGFLGEQGLGNFPTIAGANMLSMFLWMLVLENAQAKHIGIVRAAAAFLVLAIGLTHLICVLLLSSSIHMEPVGSAQIGLLMVTAALAFLAVAIAMSVMTLLLFGRKGPADATSRIPAIASTPSDLDPAASDQAYPADALMGAQVPPCIKFVSDEVVFQTMKDRFHLSQREVDTLRLAARSKTAKEIAEELFIAESTVNSHIKGIYRKCDVHSRQDLIALVDRYRKDARA